MRKYIAVALSAGLLAVPAALARQASSNGAGHGKGQPARVAKVQLATFAFSGTVTDVSLDANTIVIAPVRAHGSRSRQALSGAVTFTARLDATTRITRSAMGRVTIDKIMVGDHVKVEIRAPRGTVLADMPAAKRVKVKAANVIEPPPVVTPQSTETAPPPPPALVVGT